MLYLGSQRDFQWSHVVVLVLLVLLTLGVYFKVFQAQFVYDDFSFVVNNKAIQSFSPFSKFFSDPSVFIGSKEGPQNWRPIAALAFALEYFFFGLNPFRFHALSIIWHLFNLVLVYFLIRKLTGRPFLAGLIGALWALHPTATEAVSWIANQSSLIFLSFFILSILSLLSFLEKAQKKIWLWVSVFCFGLALLTKETALGGIFIFPLLFYNHFKEGREGILKKTFFHFLPYLILGAGYFLIRFELLKSVGDHALRGGSWGANLLLAPTVFLKYLSLTFFPVNLLLDYANFPLPLGIFDPRVFFGLLLALIFLGLLILGLKNQWLGFSLGLVWFLAFLAPVLQIIPFSDIVGERFLYGPLIGFWLALVLGLERSFDFIRQRFNFNLLGFAKAVVLVLLLWFLALTFSRNNDWLSSESLWLSVLKVDSKNEKALMNVSAYYFQAGQGEKVLEYSKKLLEINPENQAGHLHLAIGYAMTGQFNKAEKELKDLINKDPNYKIAWVNLAAVYDDLGRWGDALKILNELIKTYPDDDHIKRGIGMLEAKIKSLPQNSASRVFGSSIIDFSEVGVRPQVEGDVITSGILGQVVLGPLNKPFPAMLEVYKKNETIPLISIIANDNGQFQIPLRPGEYHLKPIENEASRPFKIKTSYDFEIKDGRWLQILVKYE